MFSLLGIAAADVAAPVAPRDASPGPISPREVPALLEKAKRVSASFPALISQPRNKKTNEHTNSLARHPIACATKSKDYFAVTRRSIPPASTTTFTSAARLEKHAFMVTEPLVRNAASLSVERYIQYILG